MEVMFVNKCRESYFYNKSFVGLIGEIKDLRLLFNHLDELNINPNKRVKHYLKNITYYEDLGLGNISLKKIKDLSSYEYKCFLLIKISLLKPDLIILNNFDLGVNDKYKNKISTFIKTMNALNKTTYLIISNNVLFQNLMCKHYIILKNGIIKYQGDLISAIKTGLVLKPEIINFIDLANQKKKVNLDYTLDSKELLKAIYRSVF